MKAYKGFTKKLTAIRGNGTYKFTEGKTHKETQANCARNGFHCAEDPLDTLIYYPDMKAALYYIVEAAGDLNETDGDSKIACTELTLIKKLDLKEFVYEAVEYIVNHPLRENNKVLRDEGFANKNFVIVRGKNPKAAGKKGTILALLAEHQDGKEIESIKIVEVDGEKIKENTFYQIRKG